MTAKPLPTWMSAMDERIARFREIRDREIAELGLATIGCVAFRDPRDGGGESMMCTWSGETKRIFLTNAPKNAGRFGITHILVGPTSKIVDVPSGKLLDEVFAEARRRDAVILEVFLSQGMTPRKPEKIP